MTYLHDLTEGSVVDWGDGTKSTITAEQAKAKDVWHTYATTSTANRVVTIDGVIDRRGKQTESAFDVNALTVVRSIGKIMGEPTSLFFQCGSLTAIHAGLFDHCTAATDFSVCFYGCSALTGETPYSMVDGKKIKLWERSPENGFAKVTSYINCFIGCEVLSDYAEIPAGWK